MSTTTPYPSRPATSRSGSTTSCSFRSEGGGLRGGRGWITTFLIVSTLGTAAFAEAADPTEDELIRQGVESRRHRDDAGALATFQKAYELHKSARAAAQMGLAEFALGR